MSFNYKKPTFAVSTCALAALLVGCGQSLEVSVKDQWVKSIRSYSLTPVYPMREDVYIGTLRLKRKTEAKNFLNSRSLGYVDLSQALVDSEKKKPTYAVSGQSKVTLDQDKKTIMGVEWSQPNSNLEGSDSGGNRLRLAALPGVSLVRLTEADLSKGGLAGLISWAIAGRVRADANLEINLTGVETLEIDDVEAVKALRSKVFKKAHVDTDFQYAICAAAGQLRSQNDLTNGQGQKVSLDSFLDKVVVSMVTRVFYARGISYSWGKNASAALGASAGVGGLPKHAGAVSTGDANSDQVTQPVPKVNIASVAPGRTIGVTAVSQNAIKQNEIFERPLAFGVQSLDYTARDLLPKGFSCSSIGPDPSPTPTPTPSNSGTSLTDGPQCNDPMAPAGCKKGN